GTFLVDARYVELTLCCRRSRSDWRSGGRLDHFHREIGDEIVVTAGGGSGARDMRIAAIATIAAIAAIAAIEFVPPVAHHQHLVLEIVNLDAIAPRLCAHFRKLPLELGAVSAFWSRAAAVTEKEGGARCAEKHAGKTSVGHGPKF